MQVMRVVARGLNETVWAAAGMASAASSEMLFYVPGDAVSFEMRGTVNLVPIYHYGQDSLKRSTDWADPGRFTRNRRPVRGCS